MKCGEGYLVGCIGYAHHAPDEPHYLRQIEDVFHKGFVDEQLRGEALSQVGSFRWGYGYGGRELCVELEDGWKNLAALHKSLSVARWYAQIEKFPPAGAEPIESRLLSKLRNRLWHEQGFRYEEGSGWIFVGSSSSRILGLGLVSWVCYSLRNVGPSPVSDGLVRSLRRAQRQTYSPDCRPKLSPYFAAIQKLQEKVTSPPALIEWLKRRGLGISISPKDNQEGRGWDTLLRETELLNYWK